MKNNDKCNTKYILMVVYNAIQYDARVIRAAEAIHDMGEKVVVISCNSDVSFKNKHFKSISFNSNLRGIILLLSFWYFVVKYCIKNKKYIKLLYVHDYYLVYIGNFLKKILNIKWIYDAHELLVERKKTKKNWRESFFAFLEKTNISSADLVISANEERERIIKSVYKLQNTIYVLNITPIKDYNNVTIKEDIMVYQGYLSKDRNLEDFILLLSYLPEKIKLKIIGGGPDYEYFKSLVVKHNLTKRVFFTGKIPYSQLLNENKNCKIGIVTYSLVGLNNYYCSPNKIYEYAQLKIPMIFSPQPFLVKLAQKYKIGKVISDDMRIDKKVQLVNCLFENLTFYQNNMEKFISDFSFENEMKKLKSSVSVLLAKSF